MEIKKIFNDKKIIKLSRSYVGSEEKIKLQNVINNKYLGMGKDVLKFEKILSKYFNKKVLCLSSGTAALHLAVSSLRPKKNSEVLVPSLTFLASYQAITAAGAIPISCDINPKTLLIDLEDIKKKITNKTIAVMPVHYAGDTVDIFKIKNIIRKTKIRIIEDASHAFGSKLHNNLIGSVGDVTCFSFDGVKNITTGEGGCVVSNDSTIIEFIDKSRLLGVENESLKRYNNKRSWSFQVNEQGWRYHLSNLNASIGIAQFEKFNKMKAKRQQIAKYYDSLLIKFNKVKIFKRNYDEIVPHIYVIRIKSKKNRVYVRNILLDYGIETGIHYYPNHFLNFFYKKNNKLINTEKLYNEILTLPLHPYITKNNVNYIVSCLKKIL